GNGQHFKESTARNIAENQARASFSAIFLAVDSLKCCPFPYLRIAGASSASVMHGSSGNASPMLDLIADDDADFCVPQELSNITEAVSAIKKIFFIMI
ncbi:hypothetical protein VPJ68_00005, partial [Parabacteroides distasonis]